MQKPIDARNPSGERNQKEKKKKSYVMWYNCLPSRVRHNDI